MAEQMYIDGACCWMDAQDFWDRMGLLVKLLPGIEEVASEYMLAAVVGNSKHAEDEDFVRAVKCYADGKRGVEVPDFIANILPCSFKPKVEVVA